MFIRSISEGPLRMGSELAEIFWGNDAVYNYISYCRHPNSKEWEIDTSFKFFEN